MIIWTLNFSISNLIVTEQAAKYENVQKQVVGFLRKSFLQ